mmetsp:Transcript_2133/g.7799  ORF Transcript_2133/g.7799 Transcript_2133/m.7799 type:complete len:208 (+) Transcript_2133:408-1031(+)
MTGSREPQSAGESLTARPSRRGARSHPFCPLAAPLPPACPIDAFFGWDAMTPCKRMLFIGSTPQTAAAAAVAPSVRAKEEWAVPRRAITVSNARYSPSTAWAYSTCRNCCGIGSSWRSSSASTMVLYVWRPAAETTEPTAGARFPVAMVRRRSGAAAANGDVHPQASPKANTAPMAPATSVLLRTIATFLRHIPRGFTLPRPPLHEM